MTMEAEDTKRAVIVGSGVTDEAFVALAKELMQVADLKFKAIEDVNTREKAAEFMELIARVASSNPLLMLMEEYGEIPAEVVISVREIVKQTVAEHERGEEITIE